MKLRIIPANWLCAIFVFDCAVMPVVKILGMSVKVSYGIAFASIMLLMLDGLYNKRMALGSSNTVLTGLILYTLLLCFGELWSMALYGVSVKTTFFKIVIGNVLMMGSLGYGYRCKGNVGLAAYWSFVANVIANCILALMGRAAPSFMVKLYSISLETFMDGYYRNGGIIGNPNSSLLVTNMILLFVVVLYRYDRIKISNLKLMSLYLLSIIADIIVSSRGELLHTIIILSYLTYWVAKKTGSPAKTLKKFASMAVVTVLVIGVLWGGLVERFPNIQISLDRMNSITSVLDSSEEGGEEDINTIARPLLRFNVFWERFRHSPIWGTGIDGNGNIADFQKGTTGYHNDFFMILGASGILGLLLWLMIIKKAIYKIGLCMLFPFMVTAISNTFVRSYFGTMLYFFIIGYVLSFKDKEEKSVIPAQEEQTVGLSANR